MLIPELESSRLFLKPFSVEKHFSKKYLNWLNDSSITSYLEVYETFNLDMLLEYINNSIRNSIFIWGIHLKQDDKHVGNIKIDPINYRHGYAEYGILIANDFNTEF